MGEGMVWRPIETVPTGQWVLLSYGGEIPVVGMKRKDGSVGRYDSMRPTFNDPKHWMPLPAPPAAAPSGEG